MTVYKGKCECGSVQFECNGDPLFLQYCHCDKCREVMAMSERALDHHGYALTAAYLTQDFKIAAGENALEEVIRNNSKLLLCHTCKCQIYGISLDPAMQGGIGVNTNNFAQPLPESFKPSRHTWYVQREVDFDDGLPKFKDSPQEQGGTGELYP